MCKHPKRPSCINHKQGTIWECTCGKQFIVCFINSHTKTWREKWFRVRTGKGGFI